MKDDLVNDTISRQAFRSHIESEYRKWGEEYDAYQVLSDLDDFPSAQPERKRGKWIGTEYDGYADGAPVYYEWKCSVCDCVVEDEEPTWNFCPNCGARMDGDQHEG